VSVSIKMKNVSRVSTLSHELEGVSLGHMDRDGGRTGRTDSCADDNVGRPSTRGSLRFGASAARSSTSTPDPGDVCGVANLDHGHLKAVS
jgi:hypothetical protein